jgi:hypothetical protein
MLRTRTRAYRRRISRWCRGRRPRGSTPGIHPRLEADFRRSAPDPAHRIGVRNAAVQGTERRLPGFARDDSGRCRPTADAIAKPPAGTCGGGRGGRSAGKTHPGGRDRRGDPATPKAGGPQRPARPAEPERPRPRHSSAAAPHPGGDEVTEMSDCPDGILTHRERTCQPEVTQGSQR